MAKSVYITEYACMRRKLDAAKFETYCKRNGYTIAETPDNADIIVFFTCASTRNEENRGVHIAHMLSAHKAKLIIAGCLPAIAPERLLEIPHFGVAATDDLDNFDRIFNGGTLAWQDVKDACAPCEHSAYTDRLVTASPVKKFIYSFEFSVYFLFLIYTKLRLRFFSEETLPCGLYLKKPVFIRVTRGCNNTCSYCVIRKAIGPLISKPIDECFSEFKQSITGDAEHIVFLSEDCGQYGLDIHSSFSELIVKCDQEYSENPLTWSFEPVGPDWVIDNCGLIYSLAAKEKLVYILCSIQSGSQRILNAMHRKYKITELAAALKTIRHSGKKLKIATEIIIGFPGETDEDVVSTLAFCREMRFDLVTIFAYCDRIGTRSYRMENKNPPGIIKKRLVRACRFFSKEKIAWHCQFPDSF